MLPVKVFPSGVSTGLLEPDPPSVSSRPLGTAAMRPPTTTTPIITIAAMNDQLPVGGIGGGGDGVPGDGGGGSGVVSAMPSDHMLGGSGFSTPQFRLRRQASEPRTRDGRRRCSGA